MSKASQQLFTQESVNNQGGWDAAIIEAQSQIEAAEKRVRRLKLSIKNFEEMRDKGEPFIAESQKQKESPTQ